MKHIQLEPRDIARLSNFGNNRCRKCSSQLNEGDIVIQVGSRPTKYYHKECFNPY